MCKSHSKEREKNSLQLTQPFGFSRQLMRQLCTKHGAAAPRDRSMELLRIDVPLQRQQQSNRRLWLDSPLGSLLQTRAESTRLTSLASQFFNLSWCLEVRKTEMSLTLCRKRIFLWIFMKLNRFSINFRLYA